MRSMRSTISIGVCTYGTVPSSQAQAGCCASAGSAAIIIAAIKMPGFIQEA